MKLKIKSAAIILGIGLFVVVGMIVKRGGFEAAWDQNGGGLVIAALVIIVLTGRTLTKPISEKPLAEPKD